jgi:hypothetical protein
LRKKKKKKEEERRRRKEGLLNRTNTAVMCFNTITIGETYVL